MSHFPPHIKPLPWETVLLIHWYDETPDNEPLCESGYLHPEHGYVWHNPIHNTDEVPAHAWMPLPLIPERP